MEKYTKYPKQREQHEKQPLQAKRSRQQLVYGIRPVMEAIDAGTQIDKVLIQNGLEGKLVQELKMKLRQAGCPFQYVPEEKLHKMTDGNHQGVVATISAIKYQSFEEVVDRLAQEGQTPFLLMLDHITDVRNLGAIVRTAECAGVHAVVVPEHGTAAINEDAIKTSSGALLRVPICREANLKTVVNYAKQSDIQVVAATEKSHMSYLDLNYQRPTMIIMGSEDTGISNDLLKLSDARAKLPIMGEVQSLNVSVAAGVFMYELLRQRQNPAE